jgi:hypothetical protein
MRSYKVPDPKRPKKPDPYLNVDLKWPARKDTDSNKGEDPQPARARNQDPQENVRILTVLKLYRYHYICYCSNHKTTHSVADLGPLSFQTFGQIRIRYESDLTSWIWPLKLMKVKLILIFLIGKE